MATKKVLEDISTNCFDLLVKYRYAKHLQLSAKARKGKITALEYTQELIYHFYQKDKELQNQFYNLLSSQIEDMKLLQDGEYKDAIIETLLWVQSQLLKQN